jgi:phytanoyl-CoA hydroxylase
MLTKEQVAEFHENGYLNGGAVVDDAQVEVLRLELERVIADKDREDVRQPDYENGCMSMVPGSHLWGNQMAFIRTLENYDAMPPLFEDHAVAVVPRLVKKGEVHYHHALTWHGSHNNTSNRPRRAIAMHYMTHETRYEASGDHAMKPFVDVADGEILRGEHFPTVWKKA